MKFVFAIAIVVLCQCMATEAGRFTKVPEYQSFVTSSRNSRNALWRDVRSLESSRNSHTSRIHSLQSQTRSLHSLLAVQHRASSALKSSSYSLYRKAISLRSRVDNHASRLAKLATANDCAYSDNLALCMISKFLDF